MEIIESSIFSKYIYQYLSDDAYRDLQIALVEHPDLGDEIKGTGGIRKVRWSAYGKGKRAGVRIIYYWFIKDQQIFMLYFYPKNVQDDLTPDQLKRIKSMVEIELDERQL